MVKKVDKLTEPQLPDFDLAKMIILAGGLVLCVAVFAPMSESGWKFLLDVLQQALAAATGQPVSVPR